MSREKQTLEPKSPWLAISFGCCASSRDSIDGHDEGRDALKANGEAEMQICYDQPQLISRPRAESIHPRPTTSHSVSRHVSTWAANTRDFASRASSRASVHTLSRPRRSQSKPRPSISRPMDFRHTGGLDGMDGIQSMLDEAPMPIRRRRSFSPLELSIYLPENRLSPLPDFMNIDWDTLPPDLEIPVPALVREKDARTNSLTSIPSTSSYLIQRKPVGSVLSRRSSVSSQTSAYSRPASATLSSLPFVQEESKDRPDSEICELPTISRTSTLASPRVLSRLPSPSRGRAQTAPSRPGSLRRAKTDVDEAIRELNTIVEERRADAYRSNNQSPSLINRPPLSPSHHVPAIAPSLRMHVRSETLSDIGSAFSAPLAHKPLPNTPRPPTSGSLSGRASSPARSRAPTSLSIASSARMFSPLSSNPITPPVPAVSTPTTPIGRLSAWLKRSLPSTPATPSFRKASTPTTANSTVPNTPFYQCEPNSVPLPPATSSSAQYDRKSTSSRPSTAGSRTLAHTRQTSAETATVTLYSSSPATSLPSTPALSTRSSPRSSAEGSPRTLQDSPAKSLRGAVYASEKRESVHPRVNLLSGRGLPISPISPTTTSPIDPSAHPPAKKIRHIPAPLTLAKEKELAVEAALASSTSLSSVSTFNSRSRRSRQSLKPPQSPNYNLLRGMEIPIRPKGASEVGALPRGSLGPSPVSPVGVAF